MGLMDRTGDGPDQTSRSGEDDERAGSSERTGGGERAGDGERPGPVSDSGSEPTDGDDEPTSAMRLEELERRVAEYERVVDDITDRHRGPRGDGTRRRRCVECDHGWIVEDDRRLICDTCGYLAYL